LAKANQLVHVPSSTKKPSASQLEKWGQAAKAGFQIVPNVLLRTQEKLELDSVDVVVLLNLTLHWWGPNNLPFPPANVIAKRMGVSKRTVERHLAGLEAKGYLKKDVPFVNEEGHHLHGFDLSGLVEKLGTLAVSGIVQRNYAKQLEEELA
jgi:hypothetical protein